MDIERIPAVIATCTGLDEHQSETGEMSKTGPLDLEALRAAAAEAATAEAATASQRLADVASQVEHLEQLHLAGGACDQRHAKLWEAIHAVPLWASVSTGVLTLTLALACYVYTTDRSQLAEDRKRAWSEQGETNRANAATILEIPVIRTRQEEVMKRLDKIERQLQDNGEKLSQLLACQKRASNP